MISLGNNPSSVFYTTIRKLVLLSDVIALFAIYVTPNPGFWGHIYLTDYTPALPILLILLDVYPVPFRIWVLTGKMSNP